jgi:enamine deaminase RidA (YjgF/YER057c/UK114 family)
VERTQISTGTPWEAKAGYSRVVKVGPFVYVSGTTASDRSGQIQHVGDAYGQATYVYRKIEAALQSVNAAMQDVVRTRVYVTDMNNLESVVKAHHDFFSEIRPANTLVEVSKLATPEMLVEIEVDAVIVEAAR